MHRFYEYHIHGDNIVECERAVALIQQAFGELTRRLRGPFGVPVCPSYEFILEGIGSPIVFTLYPGFGRWNHDILDLVRRRGGTLREAADIIITAIEDRDETPLVAIEFCGALPAGNQAWQRSGRAYSFGMAKILYIYVAELGGYELGQSRERKAARLPNPAVPFSYVSFSLTNDTPTLPVFVTSPGADESSRTTYAEVFAETDIPSLLRSVILGQEEETPIEVLKFKALTFVEKRAFSARRGKTLTPEQWQEAFHALQNDGSLVDYLVTNAPLPWSKVAYIEAITPTARELMDATARLAIGLTSSELPMCIIPSTKRRIFADTVERLYEGRIRPDFLSWLRQEHNLTICWVMGFKPRGDDARPDRGLPPLARMLIGCDDDLLTVIYGPAPSSHWVRLHYEPSQLIDNNGLWEAILDVSDAILADSSTDRIRHQGYLRSHWDQERSHSGIERIFVEPNPLRIGENDVDTIIHLLLARCAGDTVFEGMCNPPGGDWSGISLQTPDRTTELRWLTLPRVSGDGAKRPDHVFQFFSPTEDPIILAVESKERAGDIDQDIGPRLKSYVQFLMRTTASIERPLPHMPTRLWTHSTRRIRPADFAMASAVAFISDNVAQITRAKAIAGADLIMCFAFASGGQSCILRLFPTTSLGSRLADNIVSVPLESSNIRVVVEDS